MNRVAVWLRGSLLGLLVVAILYTLRGPLIVHALPVVRAAAQLVAFDFSLLNVEMNPGDGGRTLLVHANLAAPILLGGHWLEPFTDRDGAEYRVTVSVTGLFAYAALFLTLLLAWPAATRAEMGIRLVLGLPLLAALLFMDAPVTVAAELWNLLYTHYATGETSKLMIFSRFLMDGGGFLLAGLLAAAAVGGSRELTARLRARSQGAARESEDAVAWNARRRAPKPAAPH